MQKKDFKLFSYLVIAIIITLGMSIVSQTVLADWIAPEANPPDKNVDRPVNVGLEFQIKDGGLQIGGDSLYKGASFIVEQGTVGIGTTNPSGKLTVFNGARNDLTLRTSDNDLEQGIAFQNSGGWYAWNIYRHQTGNKIDLRFAGGSAKDPTDLPDVLTITEDGNIGIGVTDPDAKLEINGQIKITGGSPGLKRVLSSDANGLASWNDVANLLKACADDQILKYDLDTATWGCAADDTGVGVITSVTAIPNRGIEVQDSNSAPKVGLIGTCAADQILKWNGTAWVCAADNSGGGGFWSRETATNELYPSNYANDKVGIGTNNPLARLHLSNDGAILAQGTYGSGWDGGALGAGTRLMWIPRKSAIRAGRVSGGGAAFWNNSSIGEYSVAMGNNPQASGINSVALGSWTVASNNASVALGASANAGGISAVALGSNTQATGDYSVAMGRTAQATGVNSLSVGNGTQATNVRAVAIGNSVIASGPNAVAMGNTTVSSGENSTALGRETTASGNNSTALGRETTSGGAISFAAGYLAQANGDYSTAVGREITVNGNYSLGISLHDPASAHTITQSNTMAIMGGKVGIGVANPDSTLEVQGGSVHTTDGLIIQVLPTGQLPDNVTTGHMWLVQD